MIQYKRIGEMLLEAGLINKKQLDTALKTKLGTTLRFGEVLTSLGFVSEEQVTQCLADQYGYELADLSKIQPQLEAVEMIPSVTAVSGLVLPVKVTPEKFYCIIADPLDIPMTDSLLRMAGRAVEFSLATPTVLFDAIVKAYGLGPRTQNLQVANPSKGSMAKLKNPVTIARPKRKIKIDPQEDKIALLNSLRFATKEA